MQTPGEQLPGNVSAVPTKFRIDIHWIDPLEAIDDHVLPGQTRMVGCRSAVEQADRDSLAGPASRVPTRVLPLLAGWRFATMGRKGKAKGRGMP